MPTLELPTSPPKPRETSNTHGHIVSTRKMRNRTIWQFVRFGPIGCLNTTIDLLVLNGLLWPGQGMTRLLLFNTIAYACGALDSFFFNRDWTFQREGPPNAREGVRFFLITLAAIGCNDLTLWFMGNILHPARLTHFTKAGQPQAISDAAVAYDPKHRVWLISYVFLDSTTTGGVSPSATAVSRSFDGGLPWSTPTLVSTAPSGDTSYDKPWMSCDTSAHSPFYGYWYMLWDDTPYRSEYFNGRRSDLGCSQALGKSIQWGRWQSGGPARWHRYRRDARKQRTAFVRRLYFHGRRAELGRRCDDRRVFRGIC